MDKNYSEILNINVTGYEGKWIAVVDKEIIASGNSAKDAYQKAKKKNPKAKPLLNRVDENVVMIV